MFLGAVLGAVIIRYSISAALWPGTDITSGARFRQACAPGAGSLNYELCG